MLLSSSSVLLVSRGALKRVVAICAVTLTREGDVVDGTSRLRRLVMMSEAVAMVAAVVVVVSSYTVGVCKRKGDDFEERQTSFQQS